MYLYEKIAKEKEYQEKIKKYNTPNHIVKDKKYVSLMSSMSHTYGNALAYMQNWINKFSPRSE